MEEKSLSLFGGAAAATWSRLPEELRSDTLVHEFPKQYSDDYICFSTSDLSLTGPCFLVFLANAQAMLKQNKTPMRKKAPGTFLNNRSDARHGGATKVFQFGLIGLLAEAEIWSNRS